MSSSQPLPTALSLADREKLYQLWKAECRVNPVEFAEAIDVPGRPNGAGDDDGDAADGNYWPVETRLALHHRLILQEMQRASQTKHGRLMIFAPPGSAKSSYASVVFPSHYLGRQKGRRLILGSYGDDLARKMGRRTRSIIRQPRYGAIFDVGLTAESSAAQEFALTNGSEYMAAGLLSGVTGNRAHGVIIDDPVKGRDQANSQAVSEKSWNAYNDDLKTRLIPGGWIVLIQTRWSQRDLAGRILPEDWKGESGDILCKDGNVWRVLCLQARCETDSDPLGRKRGEYLWPEWFDAGHWRQFEALPVTWAALYQQQPSPADGGIFQPDVMPMLDSIPVGTRFTRGWDLAATENDGDWTVGGKIGVMPDGRYLIADIARLQGRPDQIEAAIKNTAARDGASVPIDLPQDPGQAGKAQVAYLTLQLSGHIVRSSTESGSKVTRAEPLAAQVNVGNVAMLRGAWNDALIAEMRMFPNGSYDDQIDALSRAFNGLLDGGSWSFSTI